MIRIAAIVEGYGEDKAFPTLLARTSSALGISAVAPNPIRAGEWKSLKRPGMLERHLDLAASRKWERIITFLDLDDGCPVIESTAARARVTQWQNGRCAEVDIVFAYREYETMFLLAPSCLGDIDRTRIPQHPESVRGAKEVVSYLIGRRYKPTQDQLTYTRRLDLGTLFLASKPYRKLCKAVSGLSLEDMADAFGVSLSNVS